MSPLYNAQNPPPALFPFPPGHRFLVFNAEALVTGKFSQQLALPPGPTAGSRGIRVELDFSGDPGAFEIDVMESDSDFENGSAEYQQVPNGGQINTVTLGPKGVNTHQSSDLIPISGQFVALFVKTQPANAVNCTARISRAA